MKLYVFGTNYQGAKKEMKKKHKKTSCHAMRAVSRSDRSFFEFKWDNIFRAGYFFLLFHFIFFFFFFKTFSIFFHRNYKKKMLQRAVIVMRVVELMCVAVHIIHQNHCKGSSTITFYSSMVFYDIYIKLRMIDSILFGFVCVSTH